MESRLPEREAPHRLAPRQLQIMHRLPGLVAVAEMVGQNHELKKIIIITEKISARDSRTIRAICQMNGVDVFGGNSLGVADAWNNVRIGGALGGSKPKESLMKGSIAIYSNSGNFTTTIAVYLSTKGWGTTTSISGGKDVYIHFAPAEFFNALDNPLARLSRL